MTVERDELPNRVANTLERSLDQLDDATLTQLQQRRQAILQPRRSLRPAMMIAASLVALVLVPWLALRQGDMQQSGTALSLEWVASELSGDDDAMDDGTADNSNHDNDNADNGYLNEDPDLIADWDLVDAIGEVPDA